MELNKFLSIFGSTTFAGSVKNNLLPIVSSEKPIEFFLDTDKLKDSLELHTDKLKVSLELQLTKIDRTFPQ